MLLGPLMSTWLGILGCIVVSGGAKTQCCEAQNLQPLPFCSVCNLLKNANDSAMKQMSRAQFLNAAWTGTG